VTIQLPKVHGSNALLDGSRGPRHDTYSGTAAMRGPSARWSPSEGKQVSSPIVLGGMYVLVLGRAHSTRTDAGRPGTSAGETSTDDFQELHDYPIGHTAQERRWA